MIDPPNPLTGNTPLVMWLNQLRAAVRAARLVSVPGMKAQRGPDGQRYLPEPQSGGSSISVGMYRLKSVSAEHYVCRTWNGSTEGQADVKIAKPETLRHAAADGSVTFTYTQDTAVVWTRRASVAGQAGYLLQYIEPHFNVNSLIYAIPAPTGVTVAGVAVSLLALADGRMWSQPESEPLL